MKNSTHMSETWRGLVSQLTCSTSTRAARVQRDPRAEFRTEQRARSLSEPSSRTEYVLQRSCRSGASSEQYSAARFVRHAARCSTIASVEHCYTVLTSHLELEQLDFDFDFDAQSDFVPCTAHNTPADVRLRVMVRVT